MLSLGCAFLFAFVVLASKKKCAKIFYALTNSQRCTRVRPGLRVCESSKSLVQICYIDKNNWLRKLDLKTKTSANAWLDINKCWREAKYLVNAAFLKMGNVCMSLRIDLKNLYRRTQTLVYAGEFLHTSQAIWQVAVKSTKAQSVRDQSWPLDVFTHLLAYPWGKKTLFSPQSHCTRNPKRQMEI